MSEAVETTGCLLGAPDEPSRALRRDVRAATESAISTAERRSGPISDDSRRRHFFEPVLTQQQKLGEERGHVLVAGVWEQVRRAGGGRGPLGEGRYRDFSPYLSGYIRNHLDDAPPLRPEAAVQLVRDLPETWFPLLKRTADRYAAEFGTSTQRLGAPRLATDVYGPILDALTRWNAVSVRQALRVYVRSSQQTTSIFARRLEALCAAAARDNQVRPRLAQTISHDCAEVGTGGAGRLRPLSSASAREAQIDSKLRRAADLNEAGQSATARALLAEMLADVPVLAILLFEGDCLACRRSIMLAFKQGRSYFIGVEHEPRLPWDYLPEWDPRIEHTGATNEAAA